MTTSVLMLTSNYGNFSRSIFNVLFHLHCTLSSIHFENVTMLQTPTWFHTERGQNIYQLSCSVLDSKIKMGVIERKKA